MSKAKLYYTGRVENGVLKINGRRGFDQDLLAMEGKRVQIELKPYHATRSKEQNGYYFGCVIPYVMDALNEIGIARHKLSTESVHELLKGRFLKTDLATDEWNGEFLTEIGSTTDLNKLEFAEYIEEIRRWAAEYLSIDIPDPEKQIKINL